MDSIEGKVVVITGASSGIGEATALLLAARGARVVLGARRPGPLAELAARIEAAGGEVATAPTDVRVRSDVQALVDLAVEQFGRLDVLVNNAGVMPVSLMDELRVDDWDAMLDVNVKGVLHGIAAALPVFRAQGFGHVVNTASTAGLRIVPTMAVYAASKAAVRTISEGLRQEAGDSLRVTLITPGMTSTAGAGATLDPAERTEMQQRVTAIAMPPDAVARAIAFAVEQPATIDVGEIVIRPTAQA